MLKKSLPVICAAAVLLAAVLIQPVRAAAESVLSIFRVEAVRTINITVTELQEIAGFMKAHALAESGPEDRLEEALSSIRAQTKPLASISEFDAFPVRLPAALETETPSLSAVEARTDTAALDTAKLNSALSELGAATLVDGGLNGASVSVTLPPAFFAEYEDVVFIATQTVTADAPDDVLNALKSAVLSIPGIPDTLRAQLAPISPKTRDVYLPVIEGLGRTVDLGGATGYLYSTGELARVLSMLPQTADSAAVGRLQEANATALVWTNGGVLYCLIGDMSDSALAQIARTVR